VSVEASEPVLGVRRNGQRSDASSGTPAGRPPDPVGPSDVQLHPPHQPAFRQSPVIGASRNWSDLSRALPPPARGDNLLSTEGCTGRPGDGRKPGFRPELHPVVPTSSVADDELRESFFVRIFGHDSVRSAVVDEAGSVGLCPQRRRPRRRSPLIEMSSDIKTAQCSDRQQ